jgi:molybdopterin molybdotransferase
MSELGPSPLAAGERNVSVGQARAAIAAVVRPIAERRAVPLEQALGRVLAQDVISPIDVPAHDNSAMDGFAFNGSALRADAAVELRCVGTVFAGKPFDGRLPDGGVGECVRIMTGAVMPPSLDTVVPLELARAEGDRVHIEPGVIRAGENRRKRGEDLAAHTPALRAGQMLRPADLGLVASLGLTTVDVMRPLRVALFSTGDEVVAPGQPLPTGCIYDSNRTSLAAALRRLGMEVVDLGLVRDDPAALEATLRQAVARCDAVVTSGGVSAGDADHTRDVLARLGKVGFWKVAMRPGRPFAFGQLDADGRRACLFALPGNPVAALVTFYALARDGLLALAGARPALLPTLQARSPVAIRKRPGRTEYQRGIVTRAPDGSWQVELVGAQGAGILRSMSEANALVVLQHEQGSVAAGELVDVCLFDGLV